MAYSIPVSAEEKTKFSNVDVLKLFIKNIVVLSTFLDRILKTESNVSSFMAHMVQALLKAERTGL